MLSEENKAKQKWKSQQSKTKPPNSWANISINSQPLLCPPPPGRVLNSRLSITTVKSHGRCENWMITLLEPLVRRRKTCV